MKNEVAIGFRKTFEYRFKFTVTHLHFFIITALAFHFLTLQFDLDQLKSWRKVVVNGQEYLELSNGELIQVQEKVTPRDPKKISMRLSSNRSKARPATLESLLERELKKNTQNKQVKVSKRHGVVKGKSEAKKSFGLFNVPNLMQKEIELQKTAKTSLDLSKIRKTVYQRNNHYQKCYEKGLLNDEYMEGLVKIEILVRNQKVQKSLVDFNGSGNKNAVKELKSCLKYQLTQLRFMRDVQNEVVRFNLFFKS